jgi:uncharacterized protein with ParB-like and HNH nuclease domain
MKVESASLHGVLSGGIHFILPHFQRPYTWQINNWKDVLDDVKKMYIAYLNDQNPPEHFMGSLVVLNEGTIGISIPAYKLVDGQQRLTTISLLLRALYEHAGDERLQRRILKYLLNEDEDGEVRYKLLPTLKNDDRQTFVRVIEGDVSEHDADKNPSMVDNSYRYLSRAVRQWIIQDGYEPEKLFKVITATLQFVFIKIDQQERPYAIFESLNAKGKPLTQTDLVRNYIAMKLPGKQQERVFDQYWAKIDDLLNEDRTVARIGELTAFLRHYLAYKTGDVERVDMIYIRFRDRMESLFGTPDLFEEELKRLHQFAVWYDRLIRPEREPNAQLREMLHRLNTLESTTAYPLLLAAYDAHHAGKLSLAMFVQGLQVLENYQVRRTLVGDSGYTNRMFPGIIKMLTYANYPDSLRNALLSRRFIPDNRLRQELPNRPIYDSATQSRLVFILEEVEKYLSRGSDGSARLDSAPTVEHILPKKPTEEWKTELGEGFKEAHGEYVDTLGNLTLVTQSVNSRLSNHTFAEKLGLLRAHALRINAEYFHGFEGVWDADAIRHRAEALIDIILKIWPAFGEPEEGEDTYIPPTSVKGRQFLALVFSGDEYPMQYWRDAAVRMCNFAFDYEADFTKIQHQLPTFFKEEEQDGTTKLANGYYLKPSLNADEVLKLCRIIGEVMDLEEGKDWRLLYS